MWTPRVATGGVPGEDNKKTCKYDGRASNGDKKGKPCADAHPVRGCGPIGAFDCHCCPEGCLASWMLLESPGVIDEQMASRFKVAEKKATLRGTTAGTSHCPPELREWVGNKTAGIKNSVTQDDGTANKKTCKYDGRASNGDKKGKPCDDATRDSVVHGHVELPHREGLFCCPEGCLPAWMGVDDK